LALSGWHGWRLQSASQAARVEVWDPSHVLKWGRLFLQHFWRSIALLAGRAVQSVSSVCYRRDSHARAQVQEPTQPAAPLAIRSPPPTSPPPNETTGGQKYWPSHIRHEISPAHASRSCGISATGPSPSSARIASAAGTRLRHRHAPPLRGRLVSEFKHEETATQACGNDRLISLSRR